MCHEYVYFCTCDAQGLSKDSQTSPVPQAPLDPKPPPRVCQGPPKDPQGTPKGPPSRFQGSARTPEDLYKKGSTRTPKGSLEETQQLQLLFWQVPDSQPSQNISENNNVEPIRDSKGSLTTPSPLNINVRSDNCCPNNSTRTIQQFLATSGRSHRQVAHIFHLNVLPILGTRQIP